MRAALLDKQNNVIGEVYDAPEKGHSIEVAGCFTINGDPVNVKTYKISRSKKNLEKASYQQPVDRVIINDHKTVWTFHCVENNTVVY